MSTEWKIITLVAAILCVSLAYIFGRDQNKSAPKPKTESKTPSVRTKLSPLQFRPLIPVLLGVLIGLLYSYEYPKFEYFKFDQESGKLVEINYDMYHLIKKENIEYMSTRDPVSIFRKNSVDLNVFLIVSLIAIIASYVVMKIAWAYEEKLKLSVK
jgi:hypothetical protein